MIGSRIGKYEILSKLAEGGMGEVWRARGEQLHRNAAPKLLPHEAARDAGRRGRFEQEARALAARNHSKVGSAPMCTTLRCGCRIYISRRVAIGGAHDQKHLQ